MDLGLGGRRYAVTGASRGLGLATARHLVAEGADVLLVARDAERLGAAAERLRREGRGRVASLPGDLADGSLPSRILLRAREALGGLDGAVISVGGPPPGATPDVTDDQWRRAFEQVHLGPLRLARTLLLEAVAPQAITLVLSTSVRNPIAGLAISNGLRPGLAMAAKTLADEFGPAGHRVNVVLPGRIETERVREVEAASGDAARDREEVLGRVALRRYGTPEEFGSVAAFLTSPAASYVTGSAIAVDGGLSRSL